MGGIQSLEEFEKNIREFRFVVLHHVLPDYHSRKSHWDLLLEQPSVAGLLTFEVQSPPESWQSETIKRLPDHRPLYLTYEGPVSHDRGHVHRVRQGSLKWIQFSEDCLVFQPKDDSEDFPIKNFSLHAIPSPQNSPPRDSLWLMTVTSP